MTASGDDPIMLEKPEFDEGRKQIYASMPDLSKNTSTFSKSFSENMSASDKLTAVDEGDGAPLFDS
jgi:hypothetical protein